MVRLVVVESQLWTVSVVGGIGIATFGILRWIGNKLSAFVSNLERPPRLHSIHGGQTYHYLLQGN